MPACLLRGNVRMRENAAMQAERRGAYEARSVRVALMPRCCYACRALSAVHICLRRAISIERYLMLMMLAAIAAMPRLPLLMPQRHT